MLVTPREYYTVFVGKSEHDSKISSSFYDCDQKFHPEILILKLMVKCSQMCLLLNKTNIWK